MTDSLAVIVAEMREDAARLGFGRSKCLAWADRIAALEAGAGGVVVAYQYYGTLTLAADADEFMRGEGTPLYAAAPKAREAALYSGTERLARKMRDAQAATPQADPAPPVAFRNLPDGAGFEDYRDQLAVGNLTAVDQMGFDNLLHDHIEAAEQHAEALAVTMRGLIAEVDTKHRPATGTMKLVADELRAALLRDGLAAQEGAG